MPEVWYETVEAGAGLTQGDLIFECPLIGWGVNAPQQEGAKDPEDPEVLQQVMTAIKADVVVMTQACDLEHDKVSNVILCPHLSLDDYNLAWKAEMARQSQNPTPKAWKQHCEDICDGFVWNLTMLNARQREEPSVAHRVIDFHEVFTVPRGFLESLLEQRRQPRLRLLSPYREHLSQAFARFFMRVGLPVPVEKVW